MRGRGQGQSRDSRTILEVQLSGVWGRAPLLNHTFSFLGILNLGLMSEASEDP